MADPLPVQTAGGAGRKALFRPEVEAARSREEGNSSEPLLFETHRGVPLAGLLAAFIAISLLLLLVIPYKQTQSAVGYLSYEGPTQSVVAHQSAVVGNLLVAEGETVSRGQPLIELRSPNRDLNGEADWDYERLQTASQIRQLKEEGLLLERIRQHSEQLTLGKLDSLESELQLHVDAAELVHQQTELSQLNLDRLDTLFHSGAVSSHDLSRAQSSHIELLKEKLSSQEQLRQFGQQRKELHATLAGEDLNFRLEQLQIRSELDRLRQRQEQLSGSGGQSLVAAIDGIVQSVHVESGQFVDQGQQLLSLGPSANSLVATIYIPARLRGRVEPAQDILLSFDSFPLEEFGRYPAKLDDLSETPIDPRFNRLPLADVTEPVFVAKAKPESHFVEGTELFALQSGERFTAELISKEQSLMAYLLSPLLSLRGKLW
jgi:membrane fusion protein